MLHKFLKPLDTFLRRDGVVVPVVLLLFVDFVSKVFFHKEKFDYISEAIAKNGSTLGNMASIFTGIYFSLIILLISLPKSSIVKNLNEREYKSLVRILVSGLMSSLVYDVMQVVMSFSGGYILNRVNLYLLLIFLLNIIRCGLYFSIVLYRDLTEGFDKVDSVEESVDYIKAWVQKQDKMGK